MGLLKSRFLLPISAILYSTSIGSAMAGPLLLKAGEPNSTFVPCLKDTLCEFVRLLSPGPFPNGLFLIK
uniref:Putative secreted protein n=1 Tax=Panstrongylus lignarius TaxID=156445 RepID=A0A224XY69_9HEMI